MKASSRLVAHNSLCLGVRRDGGRCLQWKMAGKDYCRHHADQDPQWGLWAAESLEIAQSFEA